MNQVAPKRVRVYVAGPISIGDSIANIRNGIDAAEHLRKLGFVPFCPFLDALWQMAHPLTYDEMLDMDFAWIEVCDALYRIPGLSPGADLEVAHAESLGIPVFYSMRDLDEGMPRE